MKLYENFVDIVNKIKLNRKKVFQVLYKTEIHKMYGSVQQPSPFSMGMGSMSQH